MHGCAIMLFYGIAIVLGVFDKEIIDIRCDGILVYNLKHMLPIFVDIILVE
jgi:hypothetical protein